jgi:hypothetical protein
LSECAEAILDHELRECPPVVYATVTDLSGVVPRGSFPGGAFGGAPSGWGAFPGGAFGWAPFGWGAFPGGPSPGGGETCIR